MYLERSAKTSEDVESELYKLQHPNIENDIRRFHQMGQLNNSSGFEALESAALRVFRNLNANERRAYLSAHPHSVMRNKYEE